MIDANSDGLRSKVGLLSYLDYNLNFATLVACTEAFEHFAEPGDVLHEFARCLAPNGRVAIQSPSALRHRNINPLHIPQCLARAWYSGVLQPSIVHEHSLTRTYSHHWDFTLHQFGQSARQSGIVCEKFIARSTILIPMARSCVGLLTLRLAASGPSPALGGI
jgi:cyclopropane fatty-acyl-phospholipid synthase-like methyltransferase